MHDNRKTFVMNVICQLGGHQDFARSSELGLELTEPK
jgi:hypothetical protein